MRNRVFVWGSLLVCALLAVAWAHATQAPAAAIRLRVMTYNIQAGARGLDGVAAAIRAAAPDLAALQEVDVNWGARSGFADQAGELGARLGMEVGFAEIYHLPGAAGAPPRKFGVALLSRHPIAAFRNRPLTRLSTQEATPVPAPAPGLLEARVDLQGTPIRVFNTHLDYRADAAVRRRQVAEMLSAIGALLEPTIVFGDLNAEPLAPELAPLFERVRDAWQAAEDAGFTYPADAPAKRIDYVLISPHFRADSATVPALDASDHRPVVVNLTLSR